MQELKLRDYRKKKLDDTYIIMYAIKNELNLRKGDAIEPIDIYTLVGVNKMGIRQLVGIYQDKPLNNRHWLDMLEAIKARGVNDILFLSIDENKNFKRSARIIFPSVTSVDALTYIAPKFYKYTGERSAKKVAGQIHKLYLQTSLDDFQNEMILFRELYNNVVQQKVIEKYLNNIEKYYKYSYNIRDLLFKPSANMQIQNGIRIAFNHNDIYINDLDEVYEKLESKGRFFGFMSFTKNRWSMILNDLMILYPQVEFI